MGINKPKPHMEITGKPTDIKKDDELYKKLGLLFTDDQEAKTPEAKTPEAKKGAKAVKNRTKAKESSKKKALSKLPTKPVKKGTKEYEDLLAELTDIDIPKDDKLSRLSRVKIAGADQLKKKPKVRVALSKAVKKTIKEFKKVGVIIDPKDLDAKGVLKKGTPSYKAAMAYVRKPGT